MSQPNEEQSKLQDCTAVPSSQPASMTSFSIDRILGLDSSKETASATTAPADGTPRCRLFGPGNSSSAASWVNQGIAERQGFTTINEFVFSSLLPIACGYPCPSSLPLRLVNTTNTSLQKQREGKESSHSLYHTPIKCAGRQVCGT